MTDPVVAGRYRLTGMLGRGGAAEVWRATDLVLDRPVALKLLRAGSDEGSRRRFREQARHAAGLQHPGIAAVHDVGESTDGVSAWLVMELVPGESLSSVLAREGRLPVDRVLDVVAQAAAALQAAHDAGVVHRDVTPGNLLLRPDGTVAVTDVGIARLAGSDEPDDEPAGTATDLSPEQVGSRPVGPAADVYALGLVAWEALAGRRPFAQSTPEDLARAHRDDPAPALAAPVPPAVAALVARCLDKDPARRPASAGRLCAEARALAAGAGPGAGSGVQPVDGPGAGSVTTRPGLRRRRGLQLAVPVLLVAVLALVGRTTLADHRPLTAVPAVRAGSSALEATQQLREVGLQPRWSRAVDAEVPEDRVVRTDPAGGARVAVGSTVVVVVSGEVLLGRPYAQVLPVLERRGLQARVVADGTGGPPGTVRSIEPDGPQDPGTPVVVHVVPGGPRALPAAPAPAPTPPSQGARR